jgi:predicted transcriptional regulator
MQMRNARARTRDHAAFFRALGHPIRLGIVELLAQGSLNVCQLQAQFGTNLSNISRHLAVLRSVGLAVGVPYGPSLPPPGKLRAALAHRPPRKPR